VNNTGFTAGHKIVIIEQRLTFFHGSALITDTDLLT